MVQIMMNVVNQVNAKKYMKLEIPSLERVTTVTLVCHPPQ